MLIFEEKWSNYASGPKSTPNSGSFWVRLLLYVRVQVLCAPNATILLDYIPAKVKIIWKDDFFLPTNMRYRKLYMGFKWSTRSWLCELFCFMSAKLNQMHAMPDCIYKIKIVCVSICKSSKSGQHAGGLESSSRRWPEYISEILLKLKSFKTQLKWSRTDAGMFIHNISLKISFKEEPFSF